MSDIRTHESAYEAVIFDNDGVIVGPTDREVLVDAVAETFAAFDIDMDRAFAARTVDEGFVPAETVHKHGVDPEAFWHHRELTASLRQQAHARAGGKPVYDDVAVVEALSVPIGLVSNNQHATVEFLLAHHGLRYLFETVYGRAPTLAGADRRKPDPHYIEAALTDLGASDAVYVGDSEKDIVAAHRAGIDSAFVRRDHVSGTRLSVEPTHDIRELSELTALVR